MKTPSCESAAELVDVLRKHGLAATIKHKGRKVEIGVDAGHYRREVVRAVELWLMLDSSPDRIKVRCGRWRRVVRLPREPVG